MNLIIVGPSTEYTAYITEASADLTGNDFYTEEIDFDASIRDLGGRELVNEVHASEEGQDYCWLEDGFEGRCQHPISDVMPMIVLAIRHNPSDQFVYRHPALPPRSDN